MFNDFFQCFEYGMHIGEFYPSLLRLTLEEGLKLCSVITGM